VADDSVSATSVINAPVEVVFAVLADPAKHAAIDGTGWVGASLDGAPLTAAGQIFRMSMYHPNHPDGTYQMANLVQTFDPPSTISWKPGYDAEDGTLGFGGWTWRYDLTPRWTLDHHGHAFLRLVGGPGPHPGAHRFPAVPSGASGQLPGPPRRTRHLLSSSRSHRPMA
jgi:uncharacterized protein YndB with AHSA1/START domain